MIEMLKLWVFKNILRYSPSFVRERNCVHSLHKGPSVVSLIPSYFVYFNKKTFAMRLNTRNKVCILVGKDRSQPMSRRTQLPYQAYVTAFLQTDLFSKYLFFCERKAVPGQWRKGIKLVPCVWSWRSYGCLNHGKFYLKKISLWKRRERNVG